ncbi:hypothetical protein BN2476_770031 [Paraburkholderia piptadeniae]|uniref:Uncharacterized protein n=1 Tax=Paraburkholderia piptadeniae TaxID=1701573 RepID=A0A1N7SSE2_9BURK|nr:hypothetical protein BN2476_770031 [Paraburkholderia piptadeniae]
MRVFFSAQQFLYECLPRCVTCAEYECMRDWYARMLFGGQLNAGKAVKDFRGTRTAIGTTHA